MRPAIQYDDDDDDYDDDYDVKPKKYSERIKVKFENCTIQVQETPCKHQQMTHNDIQNKYNEKQNQYRSQKVPNPPFQNNFNKCTFNDSYNGHSNNQHYQQEKPKLNYGNERQLAEWELQSKNQKFLNCKNKESKDNCLENYPKKYKESVKEVFF